MRRQIPRSTRPAAAVGLLSLSLLSIAAAPCPEAGVSAERPAAERGLLLSAAAARAGRAGEFSQAVRCLRAAQVALPGSAVIRRELGVALLSAEDNEAALDQLWTAEAAGDRDPEVYELIAVALLRLGREREAARYANRARSWPADLLGASLGDAEASYRTTTSLDARKDTAALSALVLASAQGQRGERVSALRLARYAHELALQDPDEQLMVDATGFYLRRLEEAGGAMQYNFRLRAGVEQPTNAAFKSGGLSPDGPTLRAALQLDAWGQLAVGPVRLSGGLRFQQQQYLVDRSRYADDELSAYTIEARADYPLTKNPEGPTLGAAVRFYDVYGRRFGVHQGYVLQGGPVLAMQLTASLRLHMGLFGTLRNVIDAEPEPEAQSQDRDARGQRAVFGVGYRARGLRLQIEGLFIHDDAQGVAFDAVGGGLGVSLRVQLADTLWLFTRAGGLFSSYGPVGDQAIIGSASRRAELRTQLVLGCRLALSRRLSLEFSDTVLRSIAREGHDYTDNTASAAVELLW